MRRIPNIIIISSILIGSIPILGYALVALSKMIPFYDFSRILHHYNIFQILFNVFLFAVAIGMLKIQKWSFVSFIIIGVCFLFYSIYLIFFSWFGFLSYNFHISDYTILLFLISILIASLAYIIRKELAMPYLSILGRGWRLSRRESLPIKIEWSYDLGLAGYGLTENISSKGCLLPLSESMVMVFLPDAKIEMKLYFVDENIVKVVPVIGTVLRIEETISRDKVEESLVKAGILFEYVQGKTDEKWVLNFLNEKYSARYLTDLNANLEYNKKFKSTKMFNLSRTGMYLISNEMLAAKEEVTIEIHTMLGGVSCGGEVVWSNPKGLFDKPPGFGIKITKVRNLFKFYIYLFFLAYVDEIRR